MAVCLYGSQLCDGVKFTCKNCWDKESKWVDAFSARLPDLVTCVVKAAAINSEWFFKELGLSGTEWLMAEVIAVEPAPEETRSRFHGVRVFVEDPAVAGVHPKHPDRHGWEVLVIESAWLAMVVDINTTPVDVVNLRAARDLRVSDPLQRVRRVERWRLQAFIYMAMRDGEPLHPGELDRLVNDTCKIKAEPIFSNNHLAAYADEIAGLILGRKD